MYNPFAFKKNNAKINELAEQAADTATDDETREYLEKKANSLKVRRNATIVGIVSVGVAGIAAGTYAFLKENEPEIAEDILPEME